jgi:hypothetical protein
LSERHEGASLQIIENESRLRLSAEKGREREDTFEGGRHDITASREYGRTSRSRSRMAEMHGISTGDESASGTGIEDNMRRGRAVYKGRMRERKLRKRQSRL